MDACYSDDINVQNETHLSPELLLTYPRIYWLYVIFNYSVTWTSFDTCLCNSFTCLANEKHLHP